MTYFLRIGLDCRGYDGNGARTHISKWLLRASLICISRHKWLIFYG